MPNKPLSNCRICEGTGVYSRANSVGLFARTACPCTNLRWVIAFKSRDYGMKLFDKCSSQFTYATPQEAQDRLDAFIKGGTMSNVYSPDEIDSLRVVLSPCWTTGDPYGPILGDEDEGWKVR